MKRDPIDWIASEAEPRTLALAGGALFVLFLLAGYLYGLKPAWLTHAELSERRAQATLLSASGPGAEFSEVAALRTEVESLRDRLYGHAAGIPTGEIESFVVDALDQISARENVRLLGITPGSRNSIWMFDEHPYEVSVEGEFFDVHRWLTQVEEALRPMVVKQFELTPTRDRERVILDLRVAAYRAAPEGVNP